MERSSKSMCRFKKKMTFQFTWVKVRNLISRKRMKASDVEQNTNIILEVGTKFQRSPLRTRKGNPR